MERRDTIVEKYGPLSGIRVLMFGHAQAAPCAGRWLSDMGAEVIKVERPGMGDMSRAGVRQQRGEHSIVPKWISLARNVYSVEMELDFEKYPDA